MPFLLDFDECSSGNGGCAQTCTNSEGSYTCSCGTGFVLNADSHNCDGKTSHFQVLTFPESWLWTEFFTLHMHDRAIFGHNCDAKTSHFQVLTSPESWLWTEFFTLNDRHYKPLKLGIEQIPSLPTWKIMAKLGKTLKLDFQVS